MKEKGWDDGKIAQAKTSFNDKSGPTTSDDNTFKAGEYLPEGAVAGTAYYPTAWTEQQTPHNPTPEELTKIEDPTINLDRNPNAIFVYNGKSFHDPGFELKDSEGNTVQAKDVTIKIENVKIMRLHGTANAKDNVLLDDKTFEIKGDQAIDLTDISTGTADTHQIRPGVYYMTYTFHDNATDREVTVEEKRPVVILWELGDADISTIKNPSDATYISSYIKGLEQPTNGITDNNVHKLYFYRIMDADKSGVVNGSDSTKISASIAGSDVITPFYTTLN